MISRKTRLSPLLLAALCLAVTGCSSFPGSVRPNSSPSASAAPVVAPAGSYSSAGADNYGFMPPFGSVNSAANNYGGSSFVIPPPTPGYSTGTEVSQKVESLRSDLRNLQNNLQVNSDQFRAIRQDTEAFSQSYHGVVAAINARLQVGTTPGNPILVQQWNEAQSQLDHVNENIGKLNNISTMVASNSSLANYLLEAVRAAYGLSGAVDEDHRQLRILEDDTNRTTVMVERLLKELSEDISRQTSYVGSERGNLTTLSLSIKNGELYGNSLSNRGAMVSPAPSPRAYSRAAQDMDMADADAEEMPLVVIRFDKPNVSYERALYSAVSKVLERSPNADFSLVAVTPGRGNPAARALGSSSARKYADQVMRSLTNMGMPKNRVHMSSATSASADSEEVRLFVR